MQLGMIGLGRMGGNIVRRLMRDERMRGMIEVAPDGMVYYTDYARGYLGRLDRIGAIARDDRPPDGVHGDVGRDRRGPDPRERARAGVACRVLVDPFGDSVHPFLGRVVDLVEELVQRDEVGPLDVPVGLLALELEVDRIGESALAARPSLMWLNACASCPTSSSARTGTRRASVARLC